MSRPLENITAMNPSDFKETSCRLCLKNITEESFEVIDDATRDILDVFLLKMKFGDGSKVICNACRVKLKAALEFKTMCWNTDNTIISYMDCEKMLQLDLREVYMKEKASEQLTDVSYDQKICRLCMQPADSEFRCILEEELDIIEKFIPEMNIIIVKDPVVCKPCFDSLCAHNSFLKGCLEVHDKIRTFCVSSTTDGQILASSSDLLIKTEHLEEESDVKEMEISIKTEFAEVKSEESAEGRSGESSSKRRIYTCEMCDYAMKYHSGFKCHQQKHKHPLEVKTYSCKHCDYKTKYKYYLTCHSLKHKDSSQVQMFKCDACDYEGRYKKNLTRHQLTHRDSSQIQIYRCNGCDFKTKHERNMRRHILKHKDPSAIEMYTCKDCDYESRHKRYLVRHTSNHKDASQVPIFKCDECDYKSKCKTNLAHHQSVHKVPSEVETFKCNDCDFQTKHKSNIRHHLLTHRDLSEVPLYKCNYCGYETKYRRNLKRHQLTHKECTVISRLSTT